MKKRTAYLKKTVYFVAAVMSFIIMIGTTGIGISGAAALNNIGRHVDAGYLLRENFVPMKPNLSGWEYKNWKHGTGASTSIITDTNAFSEVYMTKKFLPQKSTVITAEFRLLLLSDTSGAEIKLRNSSKSALVLQINGNKLEYLEKNGARTYLKTMEYTSWVGIKIVADITTGRADIYADGKIVINDKEFTSASDTLENIFFGITSSGKGSYKIGTLEIYKGYAVYEKLLSSKQTYEQPETGNLFKGYTVRTGANNWQNSDNNASQAYLGNDGNSATFWEGRPEFNNALYVVETAGKVLKINRLTLEVPNPASGNIYFTYLNTSNEWKSLKSISVTPASYTNNKIVIDFPEVHYCLSIAIVFSSGFAQGFVPKISEFQAFYIDSGAPVQTQNLSAPSDWIAESFTDPDLGKIEVYDTAGYTPVLDYSVFRMTDNNAQKGLKLSKSFSQKGDSIIEFQMNIVSRNEMTARISQNNGNEMKIYSRGSDIYFSASGMSGEKKIISGYKTNVWYRYKIIYSASGNLAIVETNGFQAAAGKVSAGFASGVFNRIEFATADATRGTTMLDNIYIKPDVAERIVPVPKPLDTGKYILNMQVCNLWREGSHLGWQAFDGTAYENTKPLLGWYDEGDPEVSDWQIKWAVEHGINSFMYCWYRPDAGGIPNKDNSYSEELWDGYMNSRYKNMLNFTIMFTNHAPTRIYSEADMYENLMPYWIETFFKNPNYLKTSDNKPILYIYENSELLSHVGDANGDGKPGTPADVKTMFAKMRKMCVDAGFGGLIIAAEYRGNQSTVIDTLSSSGYDYVFAYTWHPIEKNMNDDSVLAQVKNYIKQQDYYADLYNNGSMKVIPNASVSWDPRAWSAINGNETSPFYTFDLAHYKKELEWMKNEFETPVIDPAGDKLIMLDNWNEFGEGHYVMPSYNIPAYNKGTVGFGYLDVIREVFRTVPFDLEHKDINPVENGFGPYDKWYPPAWTQQNKPDFPVPVDNSIKFGSSSGSQTPTDGISGNKSSGGYTSGDWQSQTSQSASSGSQPGSIGSQGQISGNSEGISGNSTGASGSINSDGNATGVKSNLLLYVLIAIAALILLAAIFYIVRKKKMSAAKTNNSGS